ncbi:polymer-forming cytoskeletal protein [Natrinema sp. S1CR25-10]|uniref:Polymer-forming cytoskeletal protein n=2 Tax=Natrinema salsiterrestre TaxID=2950540 RepID=A0A9Q4Q2P4_9EURY|nr:polymer-forming cytoskeletal protein [Natrinema salsiterrestre]
MAVLAAGILGAGVFDQTPHAELMYQEDDTGTVAIGFTDVRGLSAGNTEIRLQGEGSCGNWDGSGDLEKGDITIVDSSDCSEALEEGDVLQVIGSQTLLDTYRLQGKYPAHGCEVVDEDDFNDGSQIEIDSGNMVDCELTDDGSELDNKFQLDNGTTLVGDVYMSGLVTLTTNGQNKIIGDVDARNIDVKDGSAIEGNIVAEETVDVFDGSEIEGTIDAEDTVDINQDTLVSGTIDSDANVDLDQNSRTGSDIYSGDDVTINGNSIVEGRITADRQVDIEDDTEVDGPIEAEHNVMLGPNTVVDDNIAVDTSDRDVDLGKDTNVNGDINADDNEVILGEDATVEGDVTADSITCNDGATIDGEDCDDYTS